MLETCQNKTCQVGNEEREIPAFSPDLPRCRCLSPVMTPLPRREQSCWMAGLLPVRMSMSSIASMLAMGALPLKLKLNNSEFEGG